LIFLTSALIFFAFLFISLLILFYLRDRMNPATQRLLRLNQPSRDLLFERLRRPEQPEEEIENILERIRDKATDVLSKLTVKSFEALTEDTRLKFSKAGIRGASQIRIYLGIRTLIVIAFPTVAIFFSIIRGYEVRILVMLVLFSLLVAWSFYGLIIRQKIKRRNQSVSRNVHDAIDLLMICLEAGLGLNVALLKVGENLRFINIVLAEEFLLLNHEIQAGSTRVEAYRNMRNRTEVRELRSLLTMLIQSETLGTSLGQVLRAYSDTLRTKIRQKAEEQANKAGVKLAIPLVLFIFPPLFVVVLGPAVLQAMKLLKTFGH